LLDIHVYIYIYIVFFQFIRNIWTRSFNGVVIRLDYYFRRSHISYTLTMFNCTVKWIRPILGIGNVLRLLGRISVRVNITLIRRDYNVSGVNANEKHERTFDGPDCRSSTHSALFMATHKTKREVQMKKTTICFRIPVKITRAIR